MNKKKLFAGLLTLSMFSTTALTPISATQNYTSFNGKMKEVANYYTQAAPDGDGGVAEIVKYNKFNQTMYLVSGATQSVHIVSLASVTSDSRIDLGATRTVTLESLGINDAGDITSVDVNPNGTEIALAVQHKDYDKNGYIVRLDAQGNFISKTVAGVQPDMVTYTPDGTKILTANEGEPREGYGEGTVDPKGSITVLNTVTNEANDVDFTAFDTTDARDALVAKNVILKKGTNPSVDLEPEYITVNSNSSTAYVSLQEANSIATIDLTTNQVKRIDSLGFKDYSTGENKLDLYKEDLEINIANTNDFLGIYMPDGITSYEVNGKTYLLTANEGDSREWGEYLNELVKKCTSPVTEDKSKIVTLDIRDYDGFDDLNKNYLFGGRSFSIIDAETMQMVSDSHGEFEEITSQLLPENFNCSNDKKAIKNRSGKKGPEPEDVKVMMIDGKATAFIGLERIGGVMMYDVQNPNNPQYTDYINLRDFSEDIAGSVSPEGLCPITAQDSPTNKPLLLVANEVSGDVNVIEVAGETYQHTLAFDNSELTLNVGETKELNTTYTGYKQLTYTSDNENVATFKNNQVIAKGEGTAVITVSDGTLTATCKITVKKQAAAEVTPNPTTPVAPTDNSNKPTNTPAVKTGDDVSYLGYALLTLLTGLSGALLKSKKQTN